MAMLQLSIVLCLLAYSRPSTGQVLGDVFIYTNNYTFDPFPDLPADFGPEVPEEGIDGWLVLADPEDACQPFTIPPIDDTWVALISRSQQQHPTNCTFDVKVRHAEQAGASAAIVYDDVYEALIIMSKPRDHPEPGIPAVFVSEKAGIIMKKLMTPGQTRVRIVAVSASAWMSLVMSAFLGFLALTVVLATFYVMRSWSVWLGRTRGRRTRTDLGAGPYTTAGQPPSPGGLPACVIRALPVLVYEGKPASSRNRQQQTGSSRELSTAKQAAADQSLETSLSASVTGGWGDVCGSSIASRQQYEGRVLQQQHGASPGASFPGSPQDQLQACQENMSSSSSAPAALPDCCIVRCEAPGGNPTLDRPSEVATAAAESDSAVTPGAVAVTAAAAAAAAAAAGDVGSPSVDQISPLSSGASTPSMITDDDYDGPDQQILAGSGTAAAAAAGIVTGGPVGARGGATRRTCVVCLERYQDGDKIRVLPCQHRFHVKCIDPWLASRRLCPVCKHDASQPAVHLLQAAAGAGCTVAVGVGGSAAGSRQGAARNGIGPRWLLRGATEWLGRLSSRFRSVVSNDSSSSSSSSNRPDRDEGVSQPTNSALVSFSQQRQLLSAAAYAAAAAEAAENGLGAPSGSRSVAAVGPDIAPTAAASSQLPPLQWRRQRQRANRQLRQASSRQQRHPQADELLTPLLVSPSHSSSSSSHRRVRSSGISVPVDFGSSRSQSVREDSRSVPAGAWGVLLPVSSPPVAIPQLTPVQSDASSAGSRTPSLR